MDDGVGQEMIPVEQKKMDSGFVQLRILDDTAEEKCIVYVCRAR